MKKIFALGTTRKISQAGISLVELLLYMGLFAILITVLTDVFVSTIEVRLNSESNASFDQDARYLFNRLAYDVKRATTVTTPTNIGDTAQSLQMTISGSAYTYALVNGKLNLTSPAGVNQVNSSQTVVNSFQVKKIGNLNGKDTLSISFTLQSVTQRRGGTETRSYQTTVGRR